MVQEWWLWSVLYSSCLLLLPSPSFPCSFRLNPLCCGLPKACMGIPAQAAPSCPLLSPQCCRAVLHIFFPQSLLPGSVSAFLKRLYPEPPPALLLGSALGSVILSLRCLERSGTLWKWRCPLERSGALWKWRCPLEHSGALWKWRCSLKCSGTLWKWQCSLERSRTLWKRQHST